MAREINKRVFSALLNDLTGVVGRAHREVVDDLINRTKDVTEGLQELFLEDLQETVAAADAPSEIRVKWKPLTEKWMSTKKVTDANPRFYFGLKGQYAQLLYGASIRMIAGEPQVFLTEKSGSGRRVREDAKGYFRDPTTGRFARRIEVPDEYLMNVVLFPKFTSRRAVVDRFGGGAGRLLTQKLAAGEFGAQGTSKTRQPNTTSGGFKTASWKRPARPFITAYEVYYRVQKLSQSMQRVLR